MVLSKEQQNTLLEHAQTGLRLESCLLCLGIRPEAVEDVMRDQEVLGLWHTGRARGAQLARQQLAEEAKAGNVSAMSKLRLFKDDDAKTEDRRPPREQLSSAERKRRAAEWRKDFDERWETFRRVHEQGMERQHAKA
jgi:hypothetical protein